MTASAQKLKKKTEVFCLDIAMMIIEAADRIGKYLHYLLKLSASVRISADSKGGNKDLCLKSKIKSEQSKEKVVH